MDNPTSPVAWASRPWFGGFPPKNVCVDFARARHPCHGSVQFALFCGGRSLTVAARSVLTYSSLHMACGSVASPLSLRYHAVMKQLLIIGAVLGALAVVFGAFGAHGLEGMFEERLNSTDDETRARAMRMLANWETGARYHMYHALALIAAAWVASRSAKKGVVIAAGYCFVAGIALFSGSLYVMVLTGKTWLGAITPLGGTAMIIGWILLAVAAGKLKIE